MKYYVTSDTHGYYSLLKAALEQAGYFSEQEAHRLVILGDLFARGGEAKEMQDFILQQMASGNLILVKGNHEDLFQELVTEDDGVMNHCHSNNGTYDTVLHLTGFDLKQALCDNHGFADAAKQTPLFAKIIPSMVDYYETENYIFVHGWIPCVENWKKGRQYDPHWRDADPIRWEMARWYNGMDAVKTYRGKKTILCGHWHTSYGHSKFENRGSEFGADADFSPYYAPSIIALDACTAFSGKVNVVVLEDELLHGKSRNAERSASEK